MRRPDQLSSCPHRAQRLRPDTSMSERRDAHQPVRRTKPGALAGADTYFQPGTKVSAGRPGRPAQRR